MKCYFLRWVLVREDMVGIIIGFKGFYSVGDGYNGYDMCFKREYVSL